MPTAIIREIDQLHDLYLAGRRPRLVAVPRLTVLALDGEGAPGGTAFGDAYTALSAVSYAIKRLVRERDGIEWTVLPPEGQYWVEGDASLDDAAPCDWRWRLLVVQPHEVDESLLAAAVADTLRAHPELAATIARLHLATLEEGLCAQVEHVGSYDREEPTISHLYGWIERENLVPTGRHHEVYIGDPRRSEPARLRTIIRQPVGPA
jgi:hypothetical protein